MFTVAATACVMLVRTALRVHRPRKGCPPTGTLRSLEDITARIADIDKDVEAMLAERDRLTAELADNAMGEEEWLASHQSTAMSNVGDCPLSILHGGARFVRLPAFIACVCVEDGKRVPAAVYVREEDMASLQQFVDREERHALRNCVEALGSRAVMLTLKSAEVGEAPQPATEVYLV